VGAHEVQRAKQQNRKCVNKNGKINICTDTPVKNNANKNEQIISN